MSPSQASSEEDEKEGVPPAAMKLSWKGEPRGSSEENSAEVQQQEQQRGQDDSVSGGKEDRMSGVTSLNTSDPMSEETNEDAKPPSASSYNEDEEVEDFEGVRKTKSGKVIIPFPYKLHALLEDAEANGKEHIVSFFPHGKAFAIHKPKEFVEALMPKYFNTTRLASFHRQLNLYGFKRIVEGKDKTGFFHEFFVKGQKQLSQKIKRKKQSIPRGADVDVGDMKEESPSRENLIASLGGALGASHSPQLRPWRTSGTANSLLQQITASLHHERQQQQQQQQQQHRDMIRPSHHQYHTHAARTQALGAAQSLFDVSLMNPALRLSPGMNLPPHSSSFLERSNLLSTGSAARLPAAMPPAEAPPLQLLSRNSDMALAQALLQDEQRRAALLTLRQQQEMTSADIEELLRRRLSKQNRDEQARRGFPGGGS